MNPAYRSGFWIVPLAATVLVGVMGWRANTTVKTAMKNKIEEELRTVLSADVTALEIWMEAQQKSAGALAADARVRTLATDLVRRFDRIGLQPFDPEETKILEELRTLLTERVQPLGYPGFALLNAEGIFLAADARELLGRKLAFESRPELAQLFAKGQPQLLTPVRGLAEPTGALTQGPQSPIMAVLAPVRDEAGQVLAALGLTIRPELEFTRILSVARSGYTGETFAFNERGLLLSQSRFDEQLRSIGLLPGDTNATSVLNVMMRDPGGDLTAGYRPALARERQPLTLIATKAVSSGFDVDVEGFRDYRGVEVVGAWQWLARYGFGVATKVDLAEAFKPLLDLQNAFSTLFAALIAATLGMSSYSYLTFKLRKRVKEVEWEARKLGQYTLDIKIGEGGMGAVYRAHHALLRRPTAIKLLLPEKTEKGSISRFEREVQLTSQLTHPNTIQIYDYGRTPDGVFYYAMEYLDGITIKTLVTSDGPQPPGRIIHILIQICHSLKEAHLAHLVHRDIKPANIIISARGGLYDTVKVLDFGLVQNMARSGNGEPARAHPDDVTGTPHYMSPESIATPQSVDARSDFYSLGALGYFMLSGHEVFEGKSDSEICQHHLSTPPASPRTRFGKPFDLELEEVIMTCLAKDPARRPANASDLIDMLGRCREATRWTEAQAREWWKSFKRPATTFASRSISRTVKIDPTIKVDLTERE